MKNEQLFKETLQSLNIRNVHTTGFAPEQIFHQLENRLGDSFYTLESKICSKHAQFLKGAIASGEASESEEISEEVSQIRCSEVSDEISQLSCSEPNSTKLDHYDRSSECNSLSIDGFSEATEVIEPELWEESSDGETNFVVNLPASEVMKLLKRKDKKR